MAGQDFDDEEIDRLVKQLDAPPPRPVPAPGAPAATAQASSTDSGAPVPSRWTTARLHMPPPRREPKETFAFASSLRLPVLPVVPALDVRPAWTRFTSQIDWQSTPFAARMFVALSVLFSAAMPYWPYAHAWSWGLLVYFSAVMLLLVTGIWAAKLTWDARMPAAHTVAVGTVLWGVGLLAAEAVPRIVYA